MSNEALTAIDGSYLAALSRPLSDVALTGDQLLSLANSAVSSTLFGLSLPQSLRSNALRRIGVLRDDEEIFRSAELAPEQASKMIELYVAAIADELQDDPIVVAVLDGRTIRMLLADEDDFAMITENLFTDLDTEDKGTIKKSEIRYALSHLGVEMGVPSVLEFPTLNYILKNYGSDDEEELGQAQFASLLQCVLQDLADALSAKELVLPQNVKIANGYKSRKLLCDEKQLSNIAQRILLEEPCEQDSPFIARSVRNFLEKHFTEFGLPKPSKTNDAAILLYDSVFSEVENLGLPSGLDKDKLFKLVKVILKRFAEQLEINPVYYDLNHMFQP